MDFKQAAILGSYISKDYAEDLFRLLAAYSSISASEAASRLDLHIKTIQDFLEAMYDLGYLEREEVYEKKRPYFRYRLKGKKILMELDLSPLLPQEDIHDRTSLRIREKKNAGVRFTTSRDNQYISNIIIWTGQGRERTERRINLSIPQGKFLFLLPFPSADFQSIKKIMQKADVDTSHLSEILDIVDALIELGVIENDHHNN
jgi:DNA-binding MarR family transcriptional regulator